jgi:hypothetical protein
MEIAMVDDYRSKGVHRNRTGGKMSVNPLTRSGAPYKPKPRTTMDAIATAQKAGGGDKALARTRGMIQGDVPSRTPQPVNKGAVAAAIAKGAQDMAGAQAQANAQFNAEHEQAVAQGREMQQRMMQSTPGKAQAIIKNRRV